LACAEGLLVYSLDEGLVFDPTDLDEDVTPEAARRASASGAHARALLIALRLRDPDTLRHVVLSTPPQQVLPCGSRCFLPAPHKVMLCCLTAPQAPFAA
jgi:periodic tryptophan protein 2